MSISPAPCSSSACGVACAAVGIVADNVAAWSYNFRSAFVRKTVLIGIGGFGVGGDNCADALFASAWKTHYGVKIRISGTNFGWHTHNFISKFE